MVKRLWEKGKTQDSGKCDAYIGPKGIGARKCGATARHFRYGKWYCNRHNRTKFWAL